MCSRKSDRGTDYIVSGDGECVGFNKYTRGKIFILKTTQKIFRGSKTMVELLFEKKKILWFSFLVFSIMGLFPPWKINLTINGNSLVSPHGYGFLFVAPQGDLGQMGMAVDFPRFLVLVITALICLGILYRLAED